MTQHQTNFDPSQTDRILKLKEVMQITSLGSSTIYRHMQAGTFPKQIHMGRQRVGWLKSDIDAWFAGFREDT